MINIFDFEKPAEFLKSWLKSLPKEGWGVSRQLAEHLGVNTSLISLVLTGRQGFSAEQAFGVTQFFGWADLDTKYFLVMVQLERAGNFNLKNFYRRELSNIKKEALNLSQRLKDFTDLTESDRTQFYSSHIYSSIRLFCSLGENGKSLNEIKIGRASCRERVSSKV